MSSYSSDLGSFTGFGIGYTVFMIILSVFFIVCNWAPPFCIAVVLHML